MKLEDVADELYGLPLEQFTKTRNERAKQIKADGDKELSATVKGLPKPSVAPWVMNMLVRHQGDELEQVLVLGESLRRAQAQLDGEELRELDRQRRQLTRAIAAQARDLAKKLGQGVSPAVATQVEETLHAAMADEDAAAAVRTGQLVEPLTATGFGPVDLTGSVAVPSLLGQVAKRVEKEPPKLTVVEDDTRAREEAQEALRAAKAEAGKAEKKAAKAAKRVEKLEARNFQLQVELEELRRKISDLEYALETVDEELEDAEAQREAAAERDAEARRTVKAAQAKLDKLG